MRGKKAQMFSLLGLGLILLLSMAGDRLVFQFKWLVSRGGSNYMPLVHWTRSITALVVGIAIVLVLRYFFFEMTGTRLVAWLYLAIGLLLTFFIQFYFSRTVWQAIGYDTAINRLFVYLAVFISADSVTFHLGGILAGMGLLGVMRDERCLPYPLVSPCSEDAVS